MVLSLDFAGRTVVVTGGTRGIGAAIGSAFEDAGAARLILTGTREDELQRLNRERAERRGTHVQYVRADFADEASTQEFLDLLGGLDRVDVCVNNAGVNRILAVQDIAPADYDWLSRINLRAPLLVCGAVAPRMKAHGYGRIVNIASIWATITKPGRVMYTASKFGLVGLTKTTAVELADSGVLVNAVSPGFTLTELTRSTMSTAEIDSLARQVPLGRFATPDEIAKVVLFLASDQNTYLTGQNITVDGGFVSV
jgi:3-oxoacyl-[acyl-carrier protein] reductase